MITDYGWRIQILKKNNNNGIKGKLFGGKKKILWLIAFIIIAFFIYRVATKRNNGDSETVTSPVTKGTLAIDVIETGNIDTSDSLIIRSEVEGRTNIISIVPEGTIITEDDIKSKKLLVELDSADLRKRLTQAEVSFENQKASFTDAKSSLDIQTNLNESNLKDGELKVLFAKMELEKYVGDKLVDKLFAKDLDFDKLINDPDLGGDALQKKREFENDIFLAKEELSRAKVKLEWTQKLFDKGYVTGNDLQSDSLSLKSQEIRVEKSSTALDLFKKYEFKKNIEKLRSDYEEAKMNLNRIIAKNTAELSKAETRLRTEEAKYKQQEDDLDKTRKQVEKCKIYATKPGLVVYAGSNQPWRDNQIKEGAEVYERMELINIPNTSAMIVETKVHESDVSRVKPGLRAEITIDAMPGKQWSGVVKKVGILPDAQNRWMNPNLKVYATDVELEGDNKVLKPGMTAKVRIIIDELKNVLYVPVQAVKTIGNDKVCYVSSPIGNPVMKKVVAGQYNDKFIEIKDGLKEGEKVILNTAELYEKSKAELLKTGKDSDKKSEINNNNNQPAKPENGIKQDNGETKNPSEVKNGNKETTNNNGNNNSKENPESGKTKKRKEK